MSRDVIGGSKHSLGWLPHRAQPDACSSRNTFAREISLEIHVPPVPVVSVSDRFFDGLAVIEEIMRPAIMIGSGRSRVDPQDVIKRGQDILRIVSARDRIFASGIGWAHRPGRELVEA